MTDNRTTELREKLTERGIEWTGSRYSGVRHAEHTKWTTASGYHAKFTEYDDGQTALIVEAQSITPEQAIAATLGRPKAKSHPYGYECDTGCYDCTRCECGCINDISAKYCNDCGGEIEIDESAEKEIYHIPRNLVFAAKHDDGSLEFCERRYVPEDAATLGSDQELIDLAHNAWSMALCAMQGMPIPAEWGESVERGLREHGIDVDDEKAGFEVIDE